MKSYIAYDLSRKRFKEENNKKREVKKAKLYHGRYLVTEKYIRCGTRIAVDKPYVKRYYRSGHNSRSSESVSGYYKRYCNRCIRRLPITEEIKSGGTYRKMTEYWWSID